MKAFREITDQEWGSVEPLLPECRPQSNRDPRGRPMKNRRACMNATLFVMFTGVSWQMLPRKYPSYQTCHRCFKAWYDAGVMHKVSTVLFGNDAPSFLALVAARVRIALRETRGGVDRAVKRPLKSPVKSPLKGASKARLKKTPGATKLAHVPAPVSAPEKPRASTKAVGAAKVTKRAKVLQAPKTPKEAIPGVSLRQAALTKQPSKVVAKADTASMKRAVKPSADKRSTPSASPIVASAAGGTKRVVGRGAVPLKAAVAVRATADTARSLKGAGARPVPSSKSAKPVVQAAGVRRASKALAA